MRNFLKVADGVDVLPILHSLHLNPDLWDENDLRTTHPDSPHQEVNDIWLRFNEIKDDPSAVIDDHESICYQAWDHVPNDVIFGLMARVKGLRLGRVIITRLPKGGKIAAHVDGGDHARYYERYHVVLKNESGSIFRCGDEVVQMNAGEIWWFDNTVEHEVVNQSNDDRIVMIVDIQVKK
jgi:hypothetical protein